jgi:hypothetical protein
VVLDQAVECGILKFVPKIKEMGSHAANVIPVHKFHKIEAARTMEISSQSPHVAFMSPEHMPIGL